jgi:hypothetical protein
LHEKTSRFRFSTRFGLDSKAYEEAVKKYEKIGCIAIIIGIILALVDFISWFMQIQLHIDKKLKNDSKNI